MLLISFKFKDNANTYFKYFNFSIILFFWLKAEAGISLRPNAIQQWLYQSNSLNRSAVGSNPQRLGSTLNYNPAVSLDGNGAFMAAKAGISGIQGAGIFSIMEDDSSISYFSVVIGLQSCFPNR